MRILLLDIETAPHKGYFWGIWDQNIQPDNISEPGYTLCWAAKWFGSREILFDSVQESKPEKMIARAHSLLDEADVVVHFNGRKFDVPRLNSEFLLARLDPPSKYKQLDLLKEVRKTFGFPSNKLDYLSQQLEEGGKTKHVGMQMWRDCMEGCPKAWATMKRYNKQDVRLLERIYKRLLPWIAMHPNWGVYLDSSRPTCRNCGSYKVQSRGYERTTTLTYQRYKCMDCGAWSRARKAEKKAAEGILV